MKPIKALFATLPAVVFTGAMLAGAGAAAAAPSATPNGLTGAANMVNTHALPGMVGTAMMSNNGNGDAGMFCAVHITNGATAPGTCK